MEGFLDHAIQTLLLLRRQRTREGKALTQGHVASQRSRGGASQSSRPHVRLSGQSQDSPEAREMVWNSLGKGLRMGLVLGCQIWWNIPDGGFALTLLPTIHSGAPLRAFFFFFGPNSRQGIPASLQRNSMQFLAEHEKFSGHLWVFSAGLGQDQGDLSRQEGFMAVPQGIHNTGWQAFLFYPCPQACMAPGIPSVLPALRQAHPYPWASVLKSKRF